MNINRIFCIGKNYPEHIEELAHLGEAPTVSEAPPKPKRVRKSATKTAPDDSCVVFMKPASSFVPEGRSIRLPRERGAIHHEAELVLMLTGGGADISVGHALDYVAGITLGLDLTLRDLQTELKKKGSPWELAKAFDGAAPLGDFKPYLEQDLQELEFSCRVNGELRQIGHTKDMLFSVERQIHILSQTWALEPGDVIFTGTPKGVGPLVVGDQVVLESPQIGRFEWKCT